MVADLYGMTNVPMAAWIDEDGRLVRPVEPAGTTDAFRVMDRTTGAMPDDAIAELRDIRGAYMAGIRDWVEHGAASRFVLGEEELRERLRGPGPEQAQARAYFQLGEHLAAAGDVTRAREHFDRALELVPESWAIRRQAWNLEDPLKSGGPEFWSAVDALGDSRYYPEIEMPAAGD